MKLRQLVEQMEGILEQSKALLQKDGKLVPVAFVFYNDNVDIIGLTFRDDKEKKSQLNILKKYIKKKNAHAVYVVIESWFVKTKDPNVEIEPRLNPSRRECILIIGECEEGHHSIMQIFSRKDGKIVFGEKPEVPGFFTTIFNFGIQKKKSDESLRAYN